MNPNKAEGGEGGSTDARTTRYIRVFTQGKLLDEIEEAILKAIDGGARVLIRTGGVPEGGNAAVTEWADRLAQDHRLEWQRVGTDVIFASAQ